MEYRHVTYTHVTYYFLVFGNVAEGISVPEEEKAGYEWLQEVETPGGSEVYGKLYTGPKIVTKINTK